MTELKYIDNDGHIRVSIHGHAGYNPGNDVVCAGISALTFAMIYSLEKLSEEGSIKNLVIDLNDGETIADFVQVGDKWDTAWMVLYSGYYAIAEEYPDNLKMV